MEHQWHTLQQMFQGGEKSLRFYEITWNSREELKAGVNYLRQALGCTPLPKVNNEKKHVDHTGRTLNCSELVAQDLEYRKLMEYGPETSDILFGRPQHVDSKECIESRKGLEEIIQAHSLEFGIKFNKSRWALPPHEKEHLDANND